MKSRLVLVLMIGLISIAASDKDEYADTTAKLQRLLDSTFFDDKPIMLTRGADFTAKAGTVIFLSRKLGTERMVKLARSGEPELAMLYLPKWDAWITETEVRTVNTTRIDLRFLSAAIGSGIDVELWHTHNDVGPELYSDEEIRKRSMSWTMPSATDMVQLYEFERQVKGNAKICGVIANIYGVTTFLTDASLWQREPPTVGYALNGEGYSLNFKAGEVKLPELQEFARTYKGLVRLKFEPLQ